MYFGQSPYGAGNDAAMTYANFALQFGVPYTPAALTKTNDTNVTLTLGGTPATALLQATSLTLGWTGTLAVGRGGLGIGTTPTNGEIPIGNGTNYTAATITAGTNISISNGVGTITVNATGAASFSWNDVASGTQALAVNQGYITDNGASLVTYTLPAVSAIGSIIEISGKSAGGWSITYGTNQIIHVGNLSTTLTSGSLSSTNQWDSVRLLCVSANLVWNVISGVGNFTIV
jgi:stage V sporulation protein SpoVS